MDDLQPVALRASARYVSIAAVVSRLVSSLVELRRLNGASLYIRSRIGASVFALVEVAASPCLHCLFATPCRANLRPYRCEAASELMATAAARAVTCSRCSR